MKSFKELEAIIKILIENRMPKEHMLFMDVKEKTETDSWLKNIGSSGVIKFKFKDTDFKCDKIVYAGFTFYLVDTGYVDEELLVTSKNEE